MKKKLSPKQWIGAVFLLIIFILITLFLYSRFHEDDRFDKFTKRLFINELCSNPIHLHYTLTDPFVYGIDESTLTLPVYQADQALSRSEETASVLASLRKFHPERLSPANQYTYVLLSTYLTALENYTSFSYYDEPLSPSSGVQSELPILLADYRISSIEDIENYLSILSQIPAYLEGVILYEEEKADRGLFMSDVSADKVIEQCSTLMNPKLFESGEHFLMITFAQRLEKLKEQHIIDATQLAAWQAENDRLLTTIVAPAYDKLADNLTLLKGSGTDLQGLSHFPDGRDYYLAHLRLTTGSYRSITEIKKMLALDFEKNYTALISLLQQQPAIMDSLAEENNSFPEFSPEEMLSKLQEMITEDYPAIPFSQEGEAASCTLKYVDDCLAPYSAPAFYLTPPIDNTQENTIYINALDTAEGLPLFTTLAHEGYPGHLYQTVYCGHYQESTGVSPVRNIMYYGGYVEGWALYVELNSYDYAIRLTKESNSETELLYLADKLNRQIQLCLYSMLDILIHYEGISYEKAVQILSAIGFTEEENIKAIYEYIVEEPCNYLKYYLGYLEIETLKNHAEAAWGDSFTLYRFHSFLLNNGPADFRTLTRLLKGRQAG